MFIRVDMALERDQAKRLDDERNNKGSVGPGETNKDRRNLYLSNEGLGVGSLME